MHPANPASLVPAARRSSTTAISAPSAAPISSPIATRPCSTTHTGASSNPLRSRKQFLQQLGCMPLHSQSRKPIRNNQRQLPSPVQRKACQGTSAGLIKLPAKIRPLQVGRSIRCGRMQSQHLAAANLFQFRRQSSAFHPRVDSVASLCMCPLKVKQIARLQAHASPPQSHASRG